MNETAPELLAALEKFAALAVCEVCGEVFDTRLEGGLEIGDANTCPACAANRQAGSNFIRNHGQPGPYPAQGDREMKETPSGADLFNLFAGGVTTEEIAAMDIHTIERQIKEMRQDEPDDIHLSDKLLATQIYRYAIADTLDL